jgi:hypothetical protein
MVVPAAGNEPAAYLQGLSLADSTTMLEFSVDKLTTGGGAYVKLLARRTAKNDYRLRVRLQASGALTLDVTKLVNNVETVLTSKNLAFTYGPDTPIRLKFDVSGSTTVSLSGKAWLASAPEPSAWTVTANETTTLFAAGAPGLDSYVSASATNLPLTVSYRRFEVWS